MKLSEILKAFFCVVLLVLAILVLILALTSCVPFNIPSPTPTLYNAQPTVAVMATVEYHKDYTVTGTLYVRPCPGEDNTNCAPVDNLNTGDIVQIYGATQIEDGTFWVCIDKDCSRWIAREWITP